MESKAESRVGIAKKILLVAAVFSLPIAVLTWQVISTINQNITFAQLEMAGDSYQSPLGALLHDLQEHQRLLHCCPERGHCAHQVDALSHGIDGNLAALASVDGKYATTLGFTDAGLARLGRQNDDTRHLHSAWQAIEAAVPSPGAKLPPDIDGKYDAAIAILQAMIAQSGDTSNLILDPELDTYHFINDTLVLYPQTEERIGRMIQTGTNALAQGATAADKSALLVQASMLEQDDKDQINSNLATALKSNANEFHEVVGSFQDKLPPAYKKYEESVNQFTALTKRLSEGERVPVDEYVASGVKAREAANDLWVASLPELNNLLQLRIDHYQRIRMVGLFVSGFALLIACFIAYLVAVSVIRPLEKLTRTLGPGATLLQNSVGQLSEANATGYDAMTNQIICDELSAHAEDMRKTASSLETIVLGSGNAAAW